MALTEKTRHQLEGKKFNELYNDHEDTWIALANDARNVIMPRIKSGEPTVDVIKSILHPLIELHETYLEFMEAHPKLTQKFWSKDFTDYVLHRVYQPKLTVPTSKK